jgi:hypothetical protein
LLPYIITESLIRIWENVDGDCPVKAWLCEDGSTILYLKAQPIKVVVCIFPLDSKLGAPFEE